MGCIKATRSRRSLSRWCNHMRISLVYVKTQARIWIRFNRRREMKTYNRTGLRSQDIRHAPHSLSTRASHGPSPRSAGSGTPASDPAYFGTMLSD